MNELLITIMLIAIILAMFAVTAVLENAGAIAMWLWDMQTAYYKRKLRRKRRYTR